MFDSHTSPFPKITQTITLREANMLTATQYVISYSSYVSVIVYGIILGPAAHGRGTPAVSGVASEHCREPLRAQLPLSDSQLSWVVHL